MYTVFCEKRDAVLNIKRGFKKSWKLVGSLARSFHTHSCLDWLCMHITQYYFLHKHVRAIGLVMLKMETSSNCSTVSSLQSNVFMNTVYSNTCMVNPQMPNNDSATKIYTDKVYFHLN